MLLEQSLHKLHFKIRKTAMLEVIFRGDGNIFIWFISFSRSCESTSVAEDCCSFNNHIQNILDFRCLRIDERIIVISKLIYAAFSNILLCLSVLYIYKYNNIIYLKYITVFEALFFFSNNTHIRIV